MSVKKPLLKMLNRRRWFAKSFIENKKLDKVVRNSYGRMFGPTKRAGHRFHTRLLNTLSVNPDKA